MSRVTNYTLQEQQKLKIDLNNAFALKVACIQEWKLFLNPSLGIKTTTNGEKIIRELSEGSDTNKLAEIIDDAKEITQSVISKAEESVSDFLNDSSTKTFTDQLEHAEKPVKADVVQESVTIVKQSVTKPTSEEEESNLQQVMTSVVSEKVVSLPSSSSSENNKDPPSSDIKTPELDIDTAAFEEVTSKGIKIIDESLERVKVHMAKEIELEPTDLDSATSFEPSKSESRVTEAGCLRAARCPSRPRPPGAGIGASRLLTIQQPPL